MTYPLVRWDCLSSLSGDKYKTRLRLQNKQFFGPQSSIVSMTEEIQLKSCWWMLANEQKCSVSVDENHVRTCPFWLESYWDETKSHWERTWFIRKTESLRRIRKIPIRFVKLLQGSSSLNWPDCYNFGPCLPLFFRQQTQCFQSYYDNLITISKLEYGVSFVGE